MRKVGLDESPVGIKIAGRNSHNLRYADDTTLMAESEEELKSLLMRVKEESAKVGLKLNIRKTKIMASGPLTSWQIDGEEMEGATDFIFLGSKIIADGDCSQEIKRCLSLGRKAMANLENILKSRDITLPTKVRIVKAMLPLSLLKTAQNHPMLVELKNGETYNGHLVSCDNWMNINLREVICTSRDGDKFWRMPECYIRGSTIKYLRIPDEIIDMVKEEVVSKGRGRGGMQQQKQQKGRGIGGVGRGVFGGRGRGGMPGSGRGQQEKKPGRQLKQ
ncbi:U6 snRNA-associated Sm-like protein LSm4 [Varanus komodoensis]|nr:U6 snRNA-associated Sm-like protein LSm4 [Varanus komodoensis]